MKSLVVHIDGEVEKFVCIEQLLRAEHLIFLIARKIFLGLGKGQMSVHAMGKLEITGMF